MLSIVTCGINCRAGKGGRAKVAHEFKWERTPGGGEMEKVCLLLQRQNITRGGGAGARVGAPSHCQELKRFPPLPLPQRHLE